MVFPPNSALVEERDGLRILVKELEAESGQLRKDRDLLVSEYERAVGCEGLGFLHASLHIFNAIVNAQASATVRAFDELVEERDRLRNRVRELRFQLRDAQKAGEAHRAELELLRKRLASE